MGWFRKKALPDLVPQEYLPKHVGIIMDGNGRWASKRGLPRQAGHVTGARVFRKIVKYCEKRGIGYVTVYAFSTENFNRFEMLLTIKFYGAVVIISYNFKIWISPPTII